MKSGITPFLVSIFAFVLFSAGIQAATADFDAELLGIQQAWAIANYQTPAGTARETAFESLAKRAATFTSAHPGRAEPLLWEGIVLSTYAGAKGGLGALGLAKQARDKLQAALAIDGNVLDGSVYTSLGSLYSKVPGFPVGFGNDKKAREYLEKALVLNPDGIDSNYFFGEFLYDSGEYAQALKFLEKAAVAPARPNRELADSGRKQEISALIDKARQKLS